MHRASHLQTPRFFGCENDSVTVTQSDPGCSFFVQTVEYVFPQCLPILMICSAGWVINEGRAQCCDPVVLSQGLPVVQRQKCSWVALIPTGILILWSLPIDNTLVWLTVSLHLHLVSTENSLIFYLVQKTLHALYCAYLWLQFITNSEITDLNCKSGDDQKELVKLWHVVCGWKRKSCVALQRVC